MQSGGFALPYRYTQPLPITHDEWYYDLSQVARPMIVDAIDPEISRLPLPYSHTVAGYLDCLREQIKHAQCFLHAIRSAQRHAQARHTERCAVALAEAARHALLYLIHYRWADLVSEESGINTLDTDLGVCSTLLSRVDHKCRLEKVVEFFALLQRNLLFDLSTCNAHRIWSRMFESPAARASAWDWRSDLQHRSGGESSGVGRDGPMRALRSMLSNGAVGWLLVVEPHGGWNLDSYSDEHLSEVEGFIDDLSVFVADGPEWISIEDACERIAKSWEQGGVMRRAKIGRSKPTLYKYRDADLLQGFDWVAVGIQTAPAGDKRARPLYRWPMLRQCLLSRHGKQISQ